MDYLSRRPVTDIGKVHGLQKAQNPFRMKVVVNSESNSRGVDLQNLESFAVTLAINHLIFIGLS